MTTQQDKELSSDPVEVATRVFSAVYFNADAFGDESLEDQMRRAMRSALLSVGFDPTSPQLPVAEQPAGQAVSNLQEEAKRMQWILRQIISALPSNKDWLDPALEKEAKYWSNAPLLPVAQMSGDESHVLHVLRNPFGFDAAEIRSARLRGADLIERYRNAYANILEFAEANGLDTTARNQ